MAILQARYTLPNYPTYSTSLQDIIGSFSLEIKGRLTDVHGLIRFTAAAGREEKTFSIRPSFKNSLAIGWISNQVNSIFSHFVNWNDPSSLALASFPSFGCFLCFFEFISACTDGWGFGNGQCSTTLYPYEASHGFPATFGCPQTYNCF